LVNYSDESGHVSSNVNSMVASVTTSHARIVLYNLMHILGKRLYYHDTDSVLYLDKKNKPLLRFSCYLGELTNEIAEYGEGAQIVEYISSGPKDYFLRIKLPDGSEKHIRKVKGISLKYNNIEETSGESLKKLIDGEVTELNIKLFRKIQRAAGFEVYTVNGNKTLKLVYDKRVRINAYETIPYGTKENVPEVIPDPNIVIDDWTLRNYLA